MSKLPLLLFLALFLIGYVFLKEGKLAPQAFQVNSFFSEIFSQNHQTKIEYLLKQKDVLQQQMEALQKNVVDSTTTTVQKAEKIQASIAETQKAYEETIAAIEKLQKALQQNKEVMGLPQ